MSCCRTPSRDRGFTLIELSVALVLLALMASVLYGSLSLAGTSWDRGEAKAQQTGEMRLTEDFLRRTLISRIRCACTRFPISRFTSPGRATRLRTRLRCPGRAGAGMYYFKIAVVPNGDRSTVNARARDPGLCSDQARRISATLSVLADGIAEVRFGYFRARFRRRGHGDADLARPLGRYAAPSGSDPSRRQAGERRPVADAGGRTAHRAPGRLPELESGGQTLHLTRNHS